MFAFLLLRETGHLNLCFSHHLQHVPQPWGHWLPVPAASGTLLLKKAAQWSLRGVSWPADNTDISGNGMERSSPVSLCLCTTGVCWGQPVGLQHPFHSAGCSGPARTSHPRARNPATQSPEVGASLLHWYLCWQRNLGRRFDATVHAGTLDATPDPPWLTPFLS